MNQEKANKISQEFQRITGIECDAVFMEPRHIPTALKKNEEQGVYVFLTTSNAFKVGKAGTNSQARWNSHHYNLDTSTSSTFPKSFMADLDKFKTFFPIEMHSEINTLNKDTIKDWIQTNLSRIEFKISSQESNFALNLLEALVQFEFQPIFEGR